MHSWDNYEGRVLAEPYPLEHLIYPEGRSGFFSTSYGTGTRAIVRLTQTSSDDADLLAQWHAVAALNEPHLVALKSFGETVLDRESFTFAVMESPDATLAEILTERPMTAEETRQIAASVVPALRALHEHELVHGRLDAASVVAIGDTIKLRSDCARKIANHDDAAKLKARDVRDLANLILECLTQKRLPPRELPQLPQPFDEVISHGLQGDWTLDEISQALESGTPSMPTAAEQQVVAESATAASSAPETGADASGPQTPQSAKAGPPVAISTRDRNFLVATAAISVLIVIWLCIHLVAGAVPDTASHGSQGTVANSAAAPAISAGSPAAAPIRSNAASWRVVAYAFRRRDEADARAEALRREYPSTGVEVVEATGRLPYLVTLGGRMTRDAAMAFERKLHAERFHHAVRLQEIGAK